MEGWASYLSLLSFTSSLGDLFAEAPLLSAASSLSSYLSWLLLLCATQVFSLHSSYSAFSSLQRVALWSRTTFHPAVSMRLATSSCNPACQEHCSITHALLHATVPLRFVTAGCKPAQQERHTKSTNVRAALTMGMIIELALQSHTHFADLIFQKCPETARFFYSHYSPVRFLSTTFSDTETLLRRPEDPHYQKKQGFVPESGFTREFTRFQTVTLPNYLVKGG